MRELWPRPREHCVPPEAGRGEHRFSPRACGGSVPLLTLTSVQGGLLQSAGPQDREHTFLLSYAAMFVVIYYSSHRKIMCPPG